MDTTQAIRRTLGVLLLTASVTTLACSPSDTVKTSASASAAPFLQTDADGKFSAEFPFTPLREQKRDVVSGVELVTISYTTETAKDSVIVAYTDYPRTMQFKSAEALEGAAQGAAKNIGGVILSKTPTTFMGHPAIDIVVKNPQATANARLVLRDHRLYMVLGISEAGRPASYDHLLETFFLI